MLQVWYMYSLSETINLYSWHCSSTTSLLHILTIRNITPVIIHTTLYSHCKQTCSARRNSRVRVRVQGPTYEYEYEHKCLRTTTSQSKSHENENEFRKMCSSTSTSINKFFEYMYRMKGWSIIIITVITYAFKGAVGLVVNLLQNAAFDIYILLLILHFVKA